MSAISRQILPWIKVLGSQGIAFAAALTLAVALGLTGPWLLLAQGFTAALIGRLLRLKNFWAPIQLFLPLALVYGAALPAWAYLIAFVFCALIYWNSASEQVPLYLSNRSTWKALSALAANKGSASFVDLGSGLGGVVIFIARANPEIHASGLETAPLVYAISKISLLFQRLPNASFRYRSIWDEDLSAHDMVYCFLSPAPMPRMFEKAKAQMRPGTLFVSNSFAVPDQQPSEIVDVDDSRKTRLYIYRM
jgi:SAM-dependent methyltransferase